MTTNPQIERMAEAIYTAENTNCYEWEELATSTQERFIAEAQAAYDASNARFVPMLVEALKYYREQEWLGGEDGVAAQALAQLPKEYL